METTTQTQFAASAASLLVTCPSCEHSFEVGDVVLERLRMEAKTEFDIWKREELKKNQIREHELAKRESEVEASKSRIAKDVENQVSDKLKERLDREYPDLVAKARSAAKQESDLAMAALRAELNGKAEEISNLQLEQANLLKLQREFFAEKQRFELDKQKAISDAISNETSNIRSSIEHEYDQKLQLKDVELDRARKHAEELSRKLREKPSQELQGEAEELDLELRLTTQFPLDEVTPVKKGQRGADIKHIVKNRLGTASGSILWEVKRAQSWAGDWISKLKQDVREERATLGVIVSRVTPEGVDSFEFMDGIWIVKPEFAIALASALREGFHQTSEARKAAEGIETKATLVYKYLMSDEFKSRFGAIVETFVDMQRKLAKEKAASIRNFNQREKQHQTVLDSCFGVLGDLQGIAGQDLKSLEEIEMKALPAADEEEF